MSGHLPARRLDAGLERPSSPGALAARGSAIPAHRCRLPGEDVTVTMTQAECDEAKAALAFWHNAGPRMRSTSFALGAMDAINRGLGIGEPTPEPTPEPLPSPARAALEARGREHRGR